MLARLARVAFLVVLLAGWQAALEHPIEHLSHDDSALCDVVDALAACAPSVSAVPVTAQPDFPLFLNPVRAPRIADAPPFLSQGPPAA